ncbi:hypothetical protein JTB14_028088 [Gonioctena quinquepunctata]|nr:hypothetical protein JTB14_028088 [Gonioctena quinquepunctata]
MGPKTFLKQNEKEKLVEWIKEEGFSTKKKDHLILTVQTIIVNSGCNTPFVGNKPGKKWLQLFLKRHPDLSQRIPETLTSVRASVTESQLKRGFREVEESLKSDNFFKANPQRVFNLDESAFQLCPKSGKAIGPREEKNI